LHMEGFRHALMMRTTSFSSEKLSYAVSLDSLMIYSFSIGSACLVF
jgi:hypothetical protein